MAVVLFALVTSRVTVTVDGVGSMPRQLHALESLDAGCWRKPLVARLVQLTAETDAVRASCWKRGTTTSVVVVLLACQTLSLLPCSLFPRAADSRQIGRRSVEVEGNGNGNGGGVDGDVAAAKSLGLLLQLRNAGLGNGSVASQVLEHVLDGALVQKTGLQSFDQRHAGPEHGKD